MPKKKDKSFEGKLAEAEELVDALENGELSLDESLKKYEKGVENLRACVKMLQVAEEKVQVLVEESKDVFSLTELDKLDGDDE